MIKQSQEYTKATELNTHPICLGRIFNIFGQNPPNIKLSCIFFIAACSEEKKQKAPVSLVEISTAPDMVSRTALAGMPPLPPLVLRRGPQ